ncbi:hypothetical protein DRQ29_07735, partial [bacterium]
MYFISKMKNIFQKIIIIILISFASLISAQETQDAQKNEYSFDRGVPQECKDCGPCSNETTTQNPICTCFEKIVFQDADIQAIYALLADTAGINIVADPDLKIKISLKLENVSWCQFF